MEYVWVPVQIKFTITIEHMAIFVIKSIVIQINYQVYGSINRVCWQQALDTDLVPYPWPGKRKKCKQNHFVLVCMIISIKHFLYNCYMGENVTRHGPQSYHMFET